MWKSEGQRHALAAKGIKTADIHKFNKIREKVMKQREKTNKSYHSLNEVTHTLNHIYESNKNNLTEKEREDLLNIKMDIQAIRDTNGDNDMKLGKILNRLSEFQREQVKQATL